MTEDEYQALLKIAENLIAADPTPGSGYGKRLNEIVPLIEAYEKEHYPLRPIDRHLQQTIIHGLARKHR